MANAAGVGRQELGGAFGLETLRLPKVKNHLGCAARLFPTMIMPMILIIIVIIQLVIILIIILIIILTTISTTVSKVILIENTLGLGTCVSAGGDLESVGCQVKSHLTLRLFHQSVQFTYNSLFVASGLALKHETLLLAATAGRLINKLEMEAGSDVCKSSWNINKINHDP